MKSIYGGGGCRPLMDPIAQQKVHGAETLAPLEAAQTELSSNLNPCVFPRVILFVK